MFNIIKGLLAIAAVVGFVYILSRFIGNFFNLKNKNDKEDMFEITLVGLIVLIVILIISYVLGSVI